MFEQRINIDRMEQAAALFGSLDENDLPKYGRNLRRAILDARDTYNRFMSRETIAEPPSPFQRVGRGLAGFRKTAG